MVPNKIDDGNQVEAHVIKPRERHVHKKHVISRLERRDQEKVELSSLIPTLQGSLELRRPTPLSKLTQRSIYIPCRYYKKTLGNSKQEKEEIKRKRKRKYRDLQSISIAKTFLNLWSKVERL
jgi:hypothetical protein